MQAKHHPDLIMCRKQPGIAIGRLCEKCDGKCVVCDSYVRPATLVRVCDECNYGSYAGRCVICGGIGISDAYYCKVQSWADDHGHAPACSAAACVTWYVALAECAACCCLLTRVVLPAAGVHSARERCECIHSSLEPACCPYCSMRLLQLCLLCISPPDHIVSCDSRHVICCKF